jgi:hypothetical protein
MTHHIVFVHSIIFTMNPLRSAKRPHTRGRRTYHLAPHPSLHPPKPRLFRAQLVQLLFRVLVEVMIVLASVPRPVISGHVDQQTGPYDRVECARGEVETG